MVWLLERETHARITAILASNRTNPSALESYKPVALDVARVVGSDMHISVKGVLVDEIDTWLQRQGVEQTSYYEIINAVNAAEGSPLIKGTKFIVDSGGGSASAGWLAAMDAIGNAKKPTQAIVGDMAASAAYGLISQVGKVTATSRMTRFGSIGVAIDTSFYPNDISITSTNAPKKRPDISTPEGRAVVVEGLDDMHEIFAEKIAKGRKTTVANVNATYGQGGMFLAEKALAAGMIDEIRAASPLPATKNKANTNTKGTKMNIDQLRLEHPALYAEVLSLGKAEEKDRCLAHITAAEHSGKHDVAKKAVADGQPFTQALMVEHMFAAIGKKGTTQAIAEDKEASAADDAAKLKDETTPAKDLGDIVADAICGAEKVKA